MGSGQHRSVICFIAVNFDAAAPARHRADERLGVGAIGTYYSPGLEEGGVMGNLNVVMITLTSRDDGVHVLDRVDAATESGQITVQDVAMVYKTDKGKVKIHQT